MTKPTDLVQGTLDMLILKTVALEPAHGWAIAQRIRQVSKNVLQVNQGALYPALAPSRAAGVDQIANGANRKTTAARNIIRSQRPGRSIWKPSRQIGSACPPPSAW